MASMTDSKVEAWLSKSNIIELHWEMLVVRTWLEYSVSCKTQDFNRKARRLLLSGLLSGLMSPNRTVDSCCSRSKNVIKRCLLILPAGNTRTRTRAGAMGDIGSAAMEAFGRQLESLSSLVGLKGAVLCQL